MAMLHQTLGVWNQYKPQEVLAIGIFKYHFGPSSIKRKKDVRPPKNQGNSRHAAAQATSGCPSFQWFYLVQPYVIKGYAHVMESTLQ